MANAATSIGGKHNALRARLAKTLKNPKTDDSNIMPHKKTFRECVQEHFAPVCMVIPTDGARRLCLENGVTFSELMAPFCNFKNIRCAVRTSSSTIAVQHFAMKFRDVRDFTKCDMEAANVQLADLVAVTSKPQAADINAVLCNEENESTSDDAKFQLASERDLSTRKESQTDWFRLCRHEVLQSLRCQQTDMFDQPLSVLLVATTEDNKGQPVPALEKLSKGTQLTIPFKSKQYDTNKIPRFFMLLHDNGRHGGGVEADKKFAKVQAKFRKPSCYFLRLNSRLAKNQTTQHAHLWRGLSSLEHRQQRHSGSKDAAEAAAVARNNCAQPIIGGRLDKNDLKRIQEFTRTFARNSFLPQIEIRVLGLSAEVDKAKKGLLKKVMNWWNKPNKEFTASTGGGNIRYPCESLESKIRLLADCAFMLRDYVLAHSYYKMVKDDFKHDKAWGHHAAVLEMCAMSLFMSDTNKTPNPSLVRDISERLKAAKQNYIVGQRSSQKAGHDVKTTVRLCTRTVMLLADILLSWGKTYSRDAAKLLSSYADTNIAQQELALVRGILREQAALGYLHGGPRAQNRKYAYNMILAADAFRQCKFDLHAVYAYASAMVVYRDYHWRLIEDHINFNAGQGFGRLNDLESSVRFLVELIATGRSVPLQQQGYLCTFARVVERYNKQMELQSIKNSGPLEIDNLNLPLVNDDSLRVFTQGNSLVACSRHTAYMDEVLAKGSDTPIESQPWAALKTEFEHEMKVMASDPSSPYSDWRKIYKSYLKGAVGVHFEGEPVVVSVEVTNPLDVIVYIEKMRLYGEAEDDGVAPDASRPHHRQRSSSKMRGLASIDSKLRRPSDLSSFDSALDGPVDTSKPCLESIPKNIVLQPRSTARMWLSVTPRRRGKLAVKGVRWQVSTKTDAGSFAGRHAFKLVGKLLQNNRRNIATRKRTPDDRLKMEIVGDVPWLGATVERVPDKLLDGQVCWLRLRLQNRGTASIDCKSLFGFCSDPGMVLGTAWRVDDDTDTMEDTRRTRQWNSAGFSSRLFRISILEENEPVSGPSPSLQESKSHGTAGSAASLFASDEATATASPSAASLFGGSSANSDDEDHATALFEAEAEAKDTISPGAVVMLPLCIRAKYRRQTKGKATFRLMIQYTGVKTGLQAPITRVMRMEFPIKVVKSLSLAATLVPCAALPGSYLLSLDTANLTRTLALNVLSVHAFSRSWIMQESSYAKPNGDLAVASGSRMLMNLQHTTNEATAIARSSVLIGKQPADLDLNIPFEHLLVQENAPGYIERHMQILKQHDDRLGAKPPLPHLPSTDMALFERGEEHGEELYLVVLFEAKSRPTRYGMHTIMQVPVRTTRLTAPPIPTTRLPLSLSADYASTAILDPSSGLVIVPVHLKVTNEQRPGLDALKVAFNATTSATQPTFSWGGNVSRSALVLASGESTELRLQAIFTMPGEYNVNRFVFVVAPPEGDDKGRAIPFKFPFEYLVEVSAASNPSANARAVTIRSPPSEEAANPTQSFLDDLL